uniref:t-SNARE coiled-coil homology domain-containing protein n=1 Tax=Nelumbo nucifera TaxID=4432 RepID=A0A822Z3E4_NELNU|nr:TPA_asm: hypothetical protein HUJ06_013640 [Nelumbo nucifera]
MSSVRRISMAIVGLSFVVQKLGNLLTEEANLLSEVKDPVEQMQIMLKGINSFLRRMDATQEADEELCSLRADIRNIAYDAEDVIDSFILKVASIRRRGVQSVIKRYACYFNEWMLLCEVGLEIEAIKRRIICIWRTYGIGPPLEGEMSTQPPLRLPESRRRSDPDPNEEDDIIGMEEEVEALVEQLMKPEERCCVIAIVGMGGLGKTTLAKRVYSHNTIKPRFECGAWVYVSEQHRTRDILKEILERIDTSTKEEMESYDDDDDDDENMGDESLGLKIYQQLNDKRYLIVLDDIWTKEVWDDLKSAFPDGKNGSKILVTTRSINVAWHVDPQGRHHTPRFLTSEESWELLRRKAFPENGDADRSYSTVKENLGRQMVQYCSGLPLAIVVIGGLLATKEEEYGWQVVSNNIVNAQVGVEKILALSYCDLPYHLKPCFLYMGIFPANFDISTSKLYRLWIAEGLIPLETLGDDVTVEDIAEVYLQELVQRCMVQICRSHFDGRMKTCRLHDSIRELCLQKASEENFLKIFDSRNSRDVNPSTSSSSPPFRRHAVHFVHDWD